MDKQAVCREDLLLSIDGKREFHWRCELEDGHSGDHKDGRYAWWTA